MKHKDALIVGGLLGGLSTIRGAILGTLVSGPKSTEQLYSKLYDLGWTASPMALHQELFRMRQRRMVETSRNRQERIHQISIQGRRAWRRFVSAHAEFVGLFALDNI